MTTMLDQTSQLSHMGQDKVLTEQAWSNMSGQSRLWLALLKT